MKQAEIDQKNDAERIKADAVKNAPAKETSTSKE